MNYAGPQETLHQFPEAVMLDADLETWHERMDDLIAQGARIIAFRGALSGNLIRYHATFHLKCFHDVHNGELLVYN